MTELQHLGYEPASSFAVDGKQFDGAVGEGASEGASEEATIESGGVQRMQREFDYLLGMALWSFTDEQV